MLDKIVNLLQRATISLLVLGILFSFPHIKDSYYRKVVGSSVVKIMGEKGMGTGFHVEAPSGEVYILTNAHVCASADKKDNLTILSGSTKIKRKIIAVYDKHDLCLIEKLPQKSSGLELASSASVGEDIFLVGHPAGRPLTLSKGELINRTSIDLPNYDIKSPDKCNGEWIPGVWIFPDLCLETKSAVGISAIAFPGNSGSPVVNKYCNLVGVLFAGSNQPTDSYMVPLSEVNKFLKDF